MSSITTANKLGKDIGIYVSGHIVCRASQREAEEYYEYYAVEIADHESVDTLLRIRLEGGTQSLREVSMTVGGWPAGSAPSRLSANLISSLPNSANSAIRPERYGILLGHYDDELPLIAAELLPLMERLGIRQDS